MVSSVICIVYTLYVTSMAEFVLLLLLLGSSVGEHLRWQCTNHFAAGNKYFFQAFLHKLHSFE